MSCSINAILEVLRSAVASVRDSCVDDPGSNPRLCFFLKHVYIMTMGDHNISLLSSKNKKI
jgi:hypothetical protein